MSTLLLSKALARVDAPLATVGLAAVAALSVPEIGGGTRLVLGALLAAIWAVYAVQFATTLFTHPAGDIRQRLPALAVDLLAVLIPLLAFLLIRTRDQSLYCAVWLLKPLRDSAFFSLMGRVVANEARNLIGVTALFCIVLFAVALAGYVAERGVQPDRFGSIPQAMWWAVVTLSTTGYGDEIPQSFTGRVLAGLAMMSGIGIFALWAGILATGFYQEVRRQDFVRNWQLVAAVPLFQKLGPAVLVEIVRALRPRAVPAGAEICRKGEPGDEMYFIVEGRVVVAAPSPVTLGPGSFFGEMALITGEPRSATVSAAAAVSLLSLHASDFQMLCGSSPELAEIIRQTALERRQAIRTS